jgi:hypothetical protein
VDRDTAVSVQTELVFSLVSGDGSVLYAQAETLDGILNAAKTLREDGEDVEAMVVEKSGRYDGATTALVQEDLV